MIARSEMETGAEQAHDRLRESLRNDDNLQKYSYVPTVGGQLDHDEGHVIDLLGIPAKLREPFADRGGDLRRRSSGGLADNCQTDPCQTVRR